MSDQSTATNGGKRTGVDALDLQINHTPGLSMKERTRLNRMGANSLEAALERVLAGRIDGALAVTLKDVAGDHQINLDRATLRGSMSLQQSYDVLRVQVGRINELLKAADCEVERLNKKLEAACELATNATARADGLEVQLATVTGQLVTARSEHESRVSGLKGEIASLVRTFGETTAQLRAVTTERDTAQHDLSESRAVYAAYLDETGQTMAVLVGAQRHLTEECVEEGTVHVVIDVPGLRPDEVGQQLVDIGGDDLFRVEGGIVTMRLQHLGELTLGGRMTFSIPTEIARILSQTHRREPAKAVKNDGPNYIVIHRPGNTDVHLDCTSLELSFASSEHANWRTCLRVKMSYETVKAAQIEAELSAQAPAWAEAGRVAKPQPSIVTAGEETGPATQDDGERRLPLTVEPRQGPRVAREPVGDEPTAPPAAAKVAADDLDGAYGLG